MYALRLAHATYHLVASTDKDGDSSCVSALLDHKHLVPGSTKGEFTNDTSMTELLGCKVLKSRDDATIGSNGDKLKYDSSFVNR